MQNNRRCHKRWNINALQNLELKICISPKKYQHREQQIYFKHILDISAEGLSFRSELDDSLFSPGTVLEEIGILEKGNDIILDTKGEIIYVSYVVSPLGERYYKVGIKFFKENSDRKKLLGQQHKKLITSKRQIMKILDELIDRNITVRIQYKNFVKQTILRGAFVAINGSIISTVQIVFDEPEVSCKYYEKVQKFKIVDVFLNKDEQFIQFESVVVDVQKNSITIGIPSELYTINRRITDRYSITDVENTNVIIRSLFLNKHDYRVRDLTATGLSFEFDFYWKPFVEGMILNDVTLTLPGYNPIKIVVKISHIEVLTYKCVEKKAICGVEFLSINIEDMRLIVSYLMENIYKEVKDVYGEWVQHQIDMFYSTGFIYKDKENFLRPIYKEVSDTLLKLSHPETMFFKNIIIKKDNEIAGTVSCVQSYEGTWMVQHLTVASHNRHHFYSKEVTVAIADFCSKNPEVNYQKIFWRPNNKWANKIFGKYAQNINEPTISLLHSYHYMIKKISEYDKFSTSYLGMKLETLQKKDIREIESYFIASKQLLILESDNLTKEKINLSRISEEYNKRGLVREREIFVATENGTFIGFAVVEYASLGINFSGLLNSFRVYIKNEPVAGIEEAKKLLIYGSMEYYSRRSRKFAICLAHDDDLEICEQMGFVKKKVYCCWTFSKTLALPYMKHLIKIFERFDNIAKLRHKGKV